MSVSTEVQRTLVKSPPELWAELSDPESLGRHLDELGEIRITRAEPESMLEWEAEGAKGTVRLKASGFGTKVVLSLTREVPEPQAPVEDEPPVAEEPEPEPEPEPELEPEPAPEPRRGFFARLFRRGHAEQWLPIQTIEPEPEAETIETVEPEQPAVDLAAELAAMEAQITEQTTELLTGVLDRLGAAHHRPFSRG